MSDRARPSKPELRSSGWSGAEQNPEPSPVFDLMELEETA